MSYTIAFILLIALLVLVLMGIHVAFALAALSFAGIWLLMGNLTMAISIVGTTCFAGIREYNFTIIPLFILMGCFMASSRAAGDLFYMLNYVLKKLPGGMGIATVFSNAVFAAVTGSSIASATVFSRISYPAMHRLRYSDGLALGTIAGSSVLGMLIPPSVLMIIYGMLAEVSIGKLFVAGIIPGLVLSVIYSIGIIIMSIRKPENSGRVKNAAGKWENYIPLDEDESKTPHIVTLVFRSLPIFGIMVAVLGGIWGGLCSPTEASAIGAFLTFVLAMSRGLGLSGLKSVFLETAGTTATVMFLLITAKMYSRMLALSGVTVEISNRVTQSGMPEIVIMLLIFVILVILGCVLDSNSILLIMIPLILPIANTFQWDPIWLAILVIVIVEMGLLTPPFGLVVFSMHATINRFANVPVEKIFIGTMPFFLMMILFVVILWVFPILSTWLPSLI